MIKKLISLIVFLLLANAGVRVAIVYFHDQQFKDAVRELVAVRRAASPTKSLKAQGDGARRASTQIPLDPDFIEIAAQHVVASAITSMIKVVVRGA